MKRLTAEKAIKKIESIKNSFMGVREIQRELCSMAEKNQISPAEYWRALKMTRKKKEL